MEHTNTPNKDLASFFKSKLFARILYAVVALVAALLIFQAGIFVGFSKAAYSFRGGEYFYKVFGDGDEVGSLPIGGYQTRSGGMMQMHIPIQDNFSNPFGAVGTIIKSAIPGAMVIEDQNQIERIVLVSSTTTVRSMRSTVDPSTLAPGESVIVFGTPNESGEIQADLIRIVPMSPTQSVQGTSMMFQASTTNQ